MTALRRILFFSLTCVAASPLVVTLVSPEPGDRAGPAIDSDVVAVRPFAPTPGRFLVEMTGRDFRWHFRYLEPAVVPAAATEVDNFNELQLPVGATVDLRLTSEDYIYVLRIPELGIEQIAVPGLISESTCVAGQPKTIDLLVDPLCNFRFYHDELMGRIVVQPNLRFYHRVST